MNLKEKFEAIRLLLGMEAATAAPEVEPSPAVETEKSEATSKDGTIVRWEGELAVGVAVTVVDQTGEQPAPDGSIEFEDGTIITTADGKVTELTAATVAPDQGNSDMPMNMEAVLEPLNAEIIALRADLLALKNSTAEANKSTNTAILKAMEIVELMNATPQVEEVRPMSALFTKNEEKERRILELSEALKLIQKK